MSLDCTNRSVVESGFSSGYPNCTKVDYYFDICEDMMQGIYVWVGFSIVAFLISFPSCTVVMLELVQKHRRPSSSLISDLFMLNLTVMDMIFNLFLPFSIVNYLFWKIPMFELWLNIMYSFCIAGRPLFMLCICLDCYVAVLHPVTYMSRKHRRNKALLAAAVWSYTVLYGVLTCIFSLNLISSLMLIITNFTSLVIIVPCDVFILRALRKAGPGTSAMPSVKKKAFYTVLSNLVIMVLFYLPSLAAHLCTVISNLPARVIFCTVDFFSLIGPILVQCIMPVLYLANLGKPYCCLKR